MCSEQCVLPCGPVLGRCNNETPLSPIISVHVSSTFELSYLIWEGSIAFFRYGRYHAVSFLSTVSSYPPYESPVRSLSCNISEQLTSIPSPSPPWYFYVIFTSLWHRCPPSQALLAPLLNSLARKIHSTFKARTKILHYCQIHSETKS